MKKLIVYKSVFGTTKEYAEWLGSDIGCDLESFKVSDDLLKSKDLIIVMSGTYAGFMPLVGFLKGKWNILKDKKLVVISVGMLSSDDDSSKQSFNKIPIEIQEKIKFFKVFGRMGKDVSKFKRENLEPIIKVIKRMK